MLFRSLLSWFFLPEETAKRQKDKITWQQWADAGAIELVPGRVISYTTVVEKLVDDWLAKHPEHPAIPHAEDDEAAGTVSGAEAAAALDVTDPGSILSEEPATK